MSRRRARSRPSVWSRSSPRRIAVGRLPHDQRRHRRLLGRSRRGRPGARGQSPTGRRRSFVGDRAARGGRARGLVLALTGRPRAARLLIAVGVAAIAISVAVDAPKGLDEGNAALTYEGAEAHLLEGFWLQIAAGAVLIAGGLLLPRYLRPAPAASSAETTADRGLGRAPPARSRRRQARSAVGQGPGSARSTARAAYRGRARDRHHAVSPVCSRWPASWRRSASLPRS